MPTAPFGSVIPEAIRSAGSRRRCGMSLMMWKNHRAGLRSSWTPTANGKRDAYVEPDQPNDPTKDKRIKVGFYAVGPSPADGSVWGTTLGFPGALVRLNPGSDP